jgi:hypothetical protein
MNLNDFTKGTIIPPMPPEEPVVEEETPEDPNAPILENMMLNEDEKFGENNQLLEHILMKLDDNSDKSVEEFQLMKQDETVNELKAIKEVLSKPETPFPEIPKTDLTETNNLLQKLIEETQKTWTANLILE